MAGQPFGPCTPPYTNAPPWEAGKAFSVKDDTAGGAAPPKIYVPTAYVTLTADAAFVDDTNAVEFTGVGPAVTYVPSAVEGDHGNYAVIVQRWVDGATGCGSLASTDPDYPSVSYAGPSPDGLTGCWQNATTASTTLYSAGVGATAHGTLQMPLDLPAVSNYLRYVVMISEGDTRPWTSSTTGSANLSPLSGISGWSQAGPILTEAVPVPGYTVRGPTLDIYHPTSTGTLRYIEALNPFQLVVQPFAMAQLKVLPYTLVYMPPGDTSKATFATTASFGLSMTYDNKLTNNASNSVDNKLANTFNAGASAGATIAGNAGSIGETLSSAESWDNTIQLGTGTIDDVATAQNESYAVTYTFTAQDPANVPGANGTFAAEPFWQDTFVLLTHPQIAMWQIGGQPVVSLLGASGTLGSPAFSTPTVLDLDSCYRKTGLFAAGFPLGNGETLTSSECYQLLQLDPLYGVGQSIASVAKNPRFINVTTAHQYGVDPAATGSTGDQAFAISATWVNTTTTTVQNVGSYTATITDVLSSTNSVGGSISYFGISASDTLAEGETVTNSSNWTVTLTSSMAATAQSSTTLTGSFDDNHGENGTTAKLPYWPSVAVYRDTLFGSFLYQDPTAPTH